MRIIADSGSTKTEWRIIDVDGNISQARSNGINPYYQNAETIEKEIANGLKEYLNESISSIHFYGAGCSSEPNIKKVKDGFLSFFPEAVIDINHDLLAAAHALCGHEKGIACILGTGANSCLYDGKSIIKNIPSLGYVLGDEGSGNYLGKKLLFDFCRNNMPENIKAKLIKRFALNVDDIQSNIYQKEIPARYLASFSKFIFQHIKEPYLYQLTYDAISLFFENHVLKYENADNLPVHFTGSVAFYYGNIVRKIAAEKTILVKHIIESPIAGLTLYYRIGK